MNGQISKSTQDLKYILNNNYTNVEILNFDNYLIKIFQKKKCILIHDHTLLKRYILSYIIL